MPSNLMITGPMAGQYQPFTRPLLPLSAIALAILLSGCNGDEISAQSCTDAADPNVLDCRSNTGDTGSATDEDDASTDNGGSQGDTGSGNGSGDNGSSSGGDSSSGGSTTTLSRISGVVIGASSQPLANSTVCFDLDDNGLCNTTLEPYTTTASDGSFSFSDTALQRGYGATLRAEARSGSTLSYTLAIPTPPPSTLSVDSSGTLALAITPFSTLLANEMEYNPEWVRQTDKARAALLTWLPGAEAGWLDSATPTSSWSDSAKRCATALVDSFIAAQGSTGSLAAIAAVADKVATSQSCQVTVSDSQISSQQRFFTPASLTLGSAISWSTAYQDEYSLGLYANSQFGIVYSKFHNRLISLDISSATPTVLDSAQFVHVTGSQHAIDGITGASEQLLDSVTVSPDNQTLYATVKLAGDNPGTTVGIYRASSGNLTNLPGMTASSFVAGSEFYPYAKVRTTALSADGLLLATGGEDNQIHLLKAADMSEVATLALGANVRSLAFSADGAYLYAGLAKNGSQSAAIVVLSVSNTSLSELARYNESATPIQLLPLQSGKALAYVLSASTRYGILDLSTPAQPTLANSYQAGGKVTALAETPDASALLVVTSNRLLERVDRSQSLPLLTTTLPLAPNGIAAPQAGEWLVSQKNSLQPVSYQAASVTTLDAAALASWQSAHRK